MVIIAIRNQTQWINEQFFNLDLGDKRLNMRTKIIANNMITNPSASIPQQNTEWKDIKGAYRLFDSPKVTFEKLVTPHIDNTKLKIKDRKLILAIQDTCYITYSHHESVKGLSCIGGSAAHVKGVILHNTLAVDPNKKFPEVVGILDQHIHDRTKKNEKEDSWKETKLWEEASVRISQKNINTKIVEVMDREGDVFDIMKNCLNLKHDFLIRAKSDRRVTAEKETKLFDFVKSLEPQGEIIIKVRKKKGQISRNTELSVSFSQLTLHGPKTRKNETKEGYQKA